MKDLMRRIYGDRRERSEAFFLALALQLRNERIQPTQRLVFKIAVALEVRFTSTAACRWLRDARAIDVEPKALHRPNDDREWSRRLTIAVFRALEIVDGFGSVTLAKKAARAVGHRFEDAKATQWLRPFVPSERWHELAASNLKQGRAVRERLEMAEAP